MHVPVMLSETIEYLAIDPAGVYLDCTAGLGGHTRAVAERLAGGVVIANDRDQDSLEIARQNLTGLEDRVRFHHGPFSRLRLALEANGFAQCSGLLADLGVSRYQLTTGERGFSLQSEGPLDMRMDRSEEVTAADLVNFQAEKALADLIYRYGEERRSRQIARAIVRARPIRSTLHLARVVEQAVPRTGKLHPATQTFMALRAVVNREPEELEQLLDAAPDLVRPGGRIVMITFMSLEDRAVKQRFRQLAKAGRIKILTKHVVKPHEDEVRSNPPSRSAKLRAAEVIK